MCKDLSQITRDRDLWARSYRSTELIVPSGPFTWQASHDIETALVTSLRIDINLKSHPQPVLMRKYPILRQTGNTYFSLFFGRWLCLANSKPGPGVLCYDLETDPHLDRPICIYRAPRGYHSFTCFSCTSTEGRAIGFAVSQVWSSTVWASDGVMFV